MHLLIGTPLAPRLVAEIAAVSPRVRVHHDPELLRSPRPNDHAGNPGFARDAEGERRWARLLREAEVIYGIPNDTPEALAETIARAPALRWIAATTAGVGEVARRIELPERVTITRATGVHDVPLAEFCLLGMLAFRKDLPRLRADAAARRWPERRPLLELRDATVLILGLGGVGREVARLASALGMRTLGVRSGAGDVPHVDEVHPVAALHELAPRADALVITLPLTPATEGLVDREVLSALPRGAIVVNVGRGQVVDEDALVDGLRDRHLAGAALDVFAAEPLSDDSPLWDLHNVIVSPHTAALSERESDRLVRGFCANLRAYLDGEPLRGVVDLARGF